MRFQKPVIRRITLLVFALLLGLLTALAGIHKGNSQAAIDDVPLKAASAKLSSSMGIIKPRKFSKLLLPT